MTASSASTSSPRGRTSRLFGHRPVAVAAVGTAAVLGLSACGAGQLSQTNTQVAAVSGAAGQLDGGALTVQDVQLVFADEKAAQAGNPVNLVFTAANSDPRKAYKLEGIDVDFAGATEPVEIVGEAAGVCPVTALSTPDVRQLEKNGPQATGESVSTGSADKSAEELCARADEGAEFAEGPDDAAGNPAPSTDVGRVLPVELTPLELSGAQKFGMNADVTFRFADEDPVTITAPITVPQHWDRDQSR